MKKNIYYIASIFLGLLILLTACGPQPYVNRFNIKTSYKEWVKEIGLFSHENIRVLRYNEDKDKGSIELEIIYDNDLVGYEELCDIINKHNKFVDENPDYFPENIRLNILNTAVSQQTVSYFSNFTSEDYLEVELKKECNAKIQWMQIDLNAATSEIEKNDNIHLDIPVITLRFKGADAPDGKIYEFLSEFKKVDQIILDYSNRDGKLTNFDENATADNIIEYLPNVEIYKYEFDSGKNEYHLQNIR